MPTNRDRSVLPAIFDIAPPAASLMAFLAGAATVIAAANPSDHPHTANQLGLRQVIYAAPVPLLPDLLDHGFKIEKIGVNAILALPV